MMEKLYQTRLYKKYGQFVQFCIVGGTNFLVSLLVYSGVLFLFRLFPDFRFTAVLQDDTTIKAQIANVLAFVISVLNAYVLNRIWVFRKEAKKTGKGAIVRFFSSYAFTFTLSMFLTWFWINVTHFSEFIVPFLNVLITTPLNFLLSKFFTFREKRKIEPEDGSAE